MTVVKAYKYLYPRSTPFHLLQISPAELQQIKRKKKDREEEEEEEFKRELALFLPSSLIFSNTLGFFYRVSTY